MAVLLSGTCLLHCLALPILVTVVPISQGALVMDEKTFHLVMLFFILPTSGIALAWGCSRHKDLLTIGLGATGLTLLTILALFGHDLMSLTGERLSTSAAGVVLAAAHIRNFLICRRMDCDHTEPH